MLCFVSWCTIAQANDDYSRLIFSAAKFCYLGKGSIPLPFWSGEQNHASGLALLVMKVALHMSQLMIFFDPVMTCVLLQFLHFTVKQNSLMASMQLITEIMLLFLVVVVEEFCATSISSLRTLNEVSFPTLPSMEPFHLDRRRLSTVMTLPSLNGMDSALSLQNEMVKEPVVSVRMTSLLILVSGGAPTIVGSSMKVILPLVETMGNESSFIFNLQSVTLQEICHITK